MLSTKLKEAAGNSADATLYVDDVFSTWLYTGTGAAQTITNGIDLAGNGGLVWIKHREDASGHRLFDTYRGTLKSLMSNDSLVQETTADSLTSFNSNGFSLGSSVQVNNGGNITSWTFRKATKFFDVVTYTGTGSARTIAHSLGVAPGMIIVKRTDTTGNWRVYSNGMTSAEYSMYLNLTAAQASAPTVWNSTAPTSSVFSVGTDATVNASGGTYVAYLYAHDTSSTGIIQCGSFTKTSGVDVNVALGWEPQYLFVKSINTAGNNWQVYDSMRGFCAGNTGVSAFLNPNLSAAESSNSYLFGPTATGFSGYGNLTAATYIYMAIRRPNKPPTTGAQVFSPIVSSAATGTKLTTNFTVDAQIFAGRNLVGHSTPAVNRLIGVSTNDTDSGKNLYTNTTSAEVSGNFTRGWDNTGFKMCAGFSGENTIFWNFKRAPGFFDEVCYTGDGTTNRAVAHNLTSAPNMIIAKARSGAANWFVYVSPTGPSQGGFLNTNADWAAGGWTGNWFANTTPTASNFYISYNGGFGSTLEINNSGTTYVAYLFATLAGISKVGSYTGNGSSQNIECGFAAGARFFLVKATSTTGSWWVWDSARGITAGNDPALQLNSTAAEITTADAVDPYSPGITVNQEATCSINASGVSYIFLAVA